MRKHLSGLQSLHKLNGLAAGSFDDTIPGLMILGINILQEDATSKRHTMSLPMLTRFLTKLETSNYSDMIITALRFITSVALFTSLQVRYLVSKSATAYDPFNTILIEDLTFTQCSLTLHIGAIDADSPSGDYVVLLPLDSSITCPVKAAFNLK